VHFRHHLLRPDFCPECLGDEEEYVLVSMNGLISHTPIDPRKVTFSSGKTPNPKKPGLIIFTSGSTGPPKGAALRRYNLFVLSILHCWSKNIQPGYVALNMLPTHHVTGLLVNTLPVLVGGGCVEFTHPKFDAARIWDRIRLGGLDMLSAVPTIYVRLLQHWETVLEKLEPEMREPYQAAISSIEQVHCGSAALRVHISKKWTKLCRGRQIAERYGGGTEFGNPFAHESTGSIVTVSPTCSLEPRLFWKLHLLEKADNALGLRRSKKPGYRIVPRARRRGRDFGQISISVLQVSCPMEL
jgi:acyl-CoA synthetase (AMP-forming)/AMP-acid ligase II